MQVLCRLDSCLMLNEAATFSWWADVSQSFHASLIFVDNGGCESILSLAVAVPDSL